MTLMRYTTCRLKLTFSHLMRFAFHDQKTFALVPTDRWCWLKRANKYFVGVAFYYLAFGNYYTEKAFIPKDWVGCMSHFLKLMKVIHYMCTSFPLSPILKLCSLLDL